MESSLEPFFGTLETLTGEKDVDYTKAMSICSYLTAADLHNKVMKFHIPQKTLESCYMMQNGNLFLTVNGDDKLWQLGAIDFMTELMDHVKTYAGELELEESAMYKRLNAPYVNKDRLMSYLLDD
jgi:hypothetical protein